MSEHLSWYLVELRQRLVRTLSANQVDTIVREASSHIQESVQHRMEKGADEQTATLDAIRAYGTPTKVATAFLRRSNLKVFGLSPAFVSASACIVAIVCWNFHWLTLDSFFDNFGDYRQNEIAGWIGLAALALMGLASRKSYRPRRLAITLSVVSAAILSVPIVSYWMVGGTPPPDYQGISRFHLDRDVASVQTVKSSVEDYQAFVAKGMAAYNSAKSMADLPADLRNADLAAKELGTSRIGPAMDRTWTGQGGSLVVPRKYGAFAMVRGGVIALEAVDTFEVAKAAWAESGQTVAMELAVDRSNMLRLLKSADEAKAGRIFFFNPDLYSRTVFGTLFLLPFLLLIDWVAAVTARPKFARIKKQLA